MRTIKCEKKKKKRTNHRGASRSGRWRGRSPKSFQRCRDCPCRCEQHGSIDCCSAWKGQYHQYQLLHALTLFLWPLPLSGSLSFPWVAQIPNQTTGQKMKMKMKQMRREEHWRKVGRWRAMEESWAVSSLLRSAFAARLPCP